MQSRVTKLERKKEEEFFFLLDFKLHLNNIIREEKKDLRASKKERKKEWKNTDRYSNNSQVVMREEIDGVSRKRGKKITLHDLLRSSICCNSRCTTFAPSHSFSP